MNKIKNSLRTVSMLKTNSLHVTEHMNILALSIRDQTIVSNALISPQRPASALERAFERRNKLLQGQMFRLIERLEQEGQLRMPHSKVIGGGIFELRVGGKDIARTLYAYADGRQIFLLHAFVKKSDKTPLRAIRLARQRLEDFFK